METHPSILASDVAEIVASAKSMAATPGVHGLDLLAYRFSGDSAALASDVVAAVDIPVLAAGSVDRAERIAALRKACVWGFTVGTAILDGTFSIAAASRSVEDLLAAVLAASDAPIPA